MPKPLLILFDDLASREWMPFALTRPIGELLFGAYRLRERIERVTGLDAAGYLTAEHLQGFDEPGAPPVLNLGSITDRQDTLFISSRTVPSWGIDEFDGRGVPAGPIRVGGEIVGWWAPGESELPPADFFISPGEGEGSVLEWAGLTLARPWELITHNTDQLERDLLAHPAANSSPEVSDGVHLIGESALILGDGVTIEPGTLIDLSGGPVWLDDGAEISALTRIAGPAYIGKESKILGGQLSGVSIGPVCRVHGEVEASVILGYSNKSHDGFLGHAYLGSWVNLGAMTTNSDLKNNYGSIRIWTPGGEHDTGERKLGCLIGDHVKTAIGTLLNTGTVVGAGANLFGVGMPPHYVPPFAWGIGPDAGEYDLERFLATAEVVMSRREVELSSQQRALLEAAWMLGRGHA